jgi:hypothetical protein
MTLTAGRPLGMYPVEEQRLIRRIPSTGEGKPAAKPRSYLLSSDPEDGQDPGDSVLDTRRVCRELDCQPGDLLRYDDRE